MTLLTKKLSPLEALNTFGITSVKFSESEIALVTKNYAGDLILDFGYRHKTYRVVIGDAPCTAFRFYYRGDPQLLQAHTGTLRTIIEWIAPEKMTEESLATHFFLSHGYAACVGG